MDSKKQPLLLGNLDSYRNILHAQDVANAIYYIVTQEKGDNYLICSDDSYKIIDLVVSLYSRANINLVKKDNILYDIATNLPVIIIQENQTSFETSPININGEAIKLKI